MRKFFFVATIFLSALTAQSQFRAGLFGGIANYQGDLVDEYYMSPKPVVGLTVAYSIHRRLDLRAGLYYARVAGADSLSDKPELRLRNLSFQSKIYEFSLGAELNLFDLQMKKWTPYVFGGVGVFRFDPYTYDQQNNKVYLQPLSTEGQGLPGSSAKQYNLTQLAIPFGGGVKYVLGNRLLIGAEVGLRKLFTDYLDDVSTNFADEAELLAARGPQAVEISYRADEVGGDRFYPVKGTQRGSSKFKDYYYFTGLHISYLFGEGFGRKKNNQLACPVLKE